MSSTDAEPTASTAPVPARRPGASRAAPSAKDQPRTIVKKDLADRIASTYLLPQSVANGVVQSILDEIVKELVLGNRCEFRDFGIFETQARKGRPGLNPKTLERVAVVPRTVVRFKAGRALKAMVRTLSRPSRGGPAA
jgi:nucleoid DNA-binding protein